MTFRIRELFTAAREASRSEHRRKELEKIGNLRAGTSGIVSPSGEVAGSCVRKAHVRQLGIELEELTEDKLLMFDLGFANEEVIVNKLKSVLPEGHIILQEEEIPIEWTTSNGTRVTGRPDIVILTEDKKPVLGIELKSVHSLWTARDVLFGGKPKLSNMIQAAHYMWQLDAPYKLIYTAYSQLGQGMAGADSWVSKQFPKRGEPGSEYIEYNDKGQIKHIKQFEAIYDLEFGSDGTLRYRPEGSNKWTDTIIRRADIERFFEVTSRIAETGNLGARPSQLDLLGGKAGYSDCNYCPLKETCDKYEKAGYNKWLEEVQKLASSLQKK